MRDFVGVNGRPSPWRVVFSKQSHSPLSSLFWPQAALYFGSVLAIKLVLLKTSLFHQGTGPVLYQTLHPAG